MQKHTQAAAAASGRDTVLSARAAMADETRRDERVRNVSLVTKAMRRPELGSIAGLIAVTVFFALTANPAMFTLQGAMTILNPAAQLGILAIAAALLMIGGEFDLSIGSMIAFAGLVFGLLLTMAHLPLAVSILGTFAVAAVVGACNGQLVIRTRLPSFIVTLAAMFILRGLSLVGLKAATGSTQMRGFREATSDSLLTPMLSGNAFGSASWPRPAGLPPSPTSS